MKEIESLRAGMLLVGSPDEDGVVTAAWIDGWHQKPHLGVLTGTVVEGGVHVAMEYSGWGWTIEVVGDGDGLRLVMCNVVPAGVDGAVRLDQHLGVGLDVEDGLAEHGRCLGADATGGAGEA